MKITRKDRTFFHLLLAPGMLILLLFAYLPMIGIVIAFQEFNPMQGFFKSEWVGLEHVRFLFELPDTMQTIRNTVEISLMKIVAGLIVPIAFALLLNEARIMWFKRTVQSLVYLPHFMSWVILGGILIDVLSINGGVFNQILASLGIEPIFFFGDEAWFRVMLIGTDVWKEFGFSTIVYLAALTGISPALYEAASIDGASRWQRIVYITLPGILPVVVLMSTLSLGNVLNAGFDQIFNLYNPMVIGTADIIDTYIYRMGLIQAQYGLATAIGLMKSLIGFALIVTSYRLAYRYANYRIF
ncbi:protein lplB [Cohnella sp. CIP 111063]|jgi:putative aldouronate transport system permease protein|uniref:ABC transporter permease n=1 Tax=unclassified Cohnella TaxID=2636738 RepID=UPI000B8C3758|nr:MULTISPECIES: ABC transporter permease subunit [unclassified Cohnella]OXS57559.1 protein lplB [Cohnella sp. CIP 111063]PRX70936.1 putative aldouronate transport system permease protein [Cohnella sp. SGD-V74]